MDDNEEYKVEMVNEDSPSATRTYKQTIINFGSLGRQLRIGSKSHVTINKPGYKQEMFVESVTLLIGIGKDHTADLIMTKDAWEAFKAGEKIDVTTLQEFKERFL